MSQTCYGHQIIHIQMPQCQMVRKLNPGNVIDNQIKKKNNITNNNEYRK